MKEEVLSVIAKESPITQPDLAKKLKKTRSNINNNTKELTKKYGKLFSTRLVKKTKPKVVKEYVYYEKEYSITKKGLEVYNKLK